MVQAELNLRQEFVRRATVEQRMLQAFRKHRVLTTRDLIQFGPGCSSRLKSLRKKGHEIQATYLAPGMWKYTFEPESGGGDCE